MRPVCSGSKTGTVLNLWRQGCCLLMLRVERTTCPVGSETLFLRKVRKGLHQGANVWKLKQEEQAITGNRLI